MVKIDNYVRGGDGYMVIKEDTQNELGKLFIIFDDGKKIELIDYPAESIYLK